MTFTIRAMGRKSLAAVIGCMAIGLALRIAAGTGGLWVDEAWSALYAHQAGDPVGVFLRINHDNNHHLNSLWLQLVGLGAPPLLARALAIVTGTAVIGMAALIGARRSATCAWLSAVLFAVAYVMVIYGSEARGYAPMLLALLTAIFLVESWLDEPERDPPTKALAITLLLGALGHLTMLVGAAMLAAWTGLVLWRRCGFGGALQTTLRAFGPSAILLLLLVNLVIMAAMTSETGMRIGGSLPFAPERYWAALAGLIGTTLGLGGGPDWLLPILFGAGVVVLLVRQRQDVGNRLFLYLLAVIAFPVAVGLLRPSNSEYVRYYLIPAAALLLLAGDVIAMGLRRGGAWRWAGAAALVIIVGFNLRHDLDLIRGQRGAPDRPVALMAARAPSGTSVIIERERPLAVLTVAAAESDYPLSITYRACANARFFFIDRNPGVPSPSRIERCGRRYLPIASMEAKALSGIDWTLYERAR